MLQPRLNFSVGDNMGSKTVKFWTCILTAVILFSTLTTCQDDVNADRIEASRIKRENVPENRDLTVLLVNDQKRNEYNTKIGRYHSVKPLIGLLTSTARTFIQDGVTTEFATQILGTTLDNGRIYAQLLTKSSLVLYNKPKPEDDPVQVRPTRLPSAFDGQWNVKQDLGFIDPEKFTLKNTDYLAPSSKMDLVFASKPSPDNIKYWNSPTAPENPLENQIFEEPTARRVQPVHEIPRYVQNEAFNFLDGPAIEGEKKFDFIKPSIIESVNTLHRQSKAVEPVAEPNNVNKNVESQVKETLSESNIVKVKPTHDLPTFTIKNEFSPIFYYIDNVESRSPQQPQFQQTKTPKKLFGQKSEPRPKKTFTYAGFADFTTVVGDTVIIFSPNTETSMPQNPNEVNVFPSAKRVDKLATKITHLASDIPVATSTFKAHESNTATRIVQISSEEQKVKDELKKVHYQIDGDTVGIQYNNGFNLNLDVIQPSEASVTTTESTQYTDDLEVVPIQDFSSQATEPLNKPTPSSTISDQPSVVTEPDLSEMFTNSEEEDDNTAAEVTEKTNSEESEEHESTVEEIYTTTESGHSEESFEEYETTTEFKYDQHEEIYCSDGLETLSTMTTSYKTLTYLTTYFIPQETETTTSVKSDVVVESSAGYLTNVVCKTSSIEPTPVLPTEPQTSTILESEQNPENQTKEETTVVLLTEEVTESAVKNDEKIVEDFGEKIVVSVEKSTSSNAAETEKDIQEKISTTTESVTTTHSHVEVSVSTEKSTTPSETSNVESEDIPEVQENEIDLIYKTLYTTYTYFTTFFGDQTSSVESHKSVVTNIITSTVDLSQLDPSLLEAFDEDEIAPTNVGIGRPTETFAINSIIDLVKNKDVLESVENGELYNSQTPTPSLGDDISTIIKPDAVKTYFTTYTFFTTIYVGTDANVCSRNEVYTNYVGPEELIPTKSMIVQNTKPQFDFRNCKQVKNMAPPTTEDNSSVESSVSMEKSDSLKYNAEKEKLQPSSLEVDMLFSVESNPLESENSFVTDVKSSSSKGERKILDNNNVLDDQISSESNIDEIMPSPTLLLQTSYTTFTYFTTMYIGKDSSKVKSRLETITNVVTETITPKKEVEEESNLPITYYTTFTYWTTLYKDKSTTITSREEVVSNVVTPVAQVEATVSPIDTTPIDIESELPPKDFEVALKPTDSLDQDDGKATFYTTYTYFTTFYAGNTSHIRSSLETVTNIVENTKVLDDNQLGRKIQSGPADKNLIGDQGEKPKIVPTVVKGEIKATQLPNLAASSPTVLLGTYIDNLFAEVKPNEQSTPKSETEQKIIFSQVAVISGDSTVVTNDNKTLINDSITTLPTTTESSILSSSPDIIESSVAEPETTSESNDAKTDVEDEGDNSNPRKKGRLTFTTKKPSFTPVIIPFASRNRPTFSPKKVPLPSSATTITRADITTTITATPTLKSVRASGFGGSSRKQSGFSSAGSSSRRFSGRSSAVPNSPSFNAPSVSRSSGFGRGSIQPSSRRTGFRSSSIRGSSLDYISRSSALPRIRPTATSRLRGGRQSASVSVPPIDQNETEILSTQQEDHATNPIEEITEAPVKATNNPLLRFRRPPLARQPGTAVTPRAVSTTKRSTPSRGGRVTTTTRRTTTRLTTNPILSLRRQRPNALFPKRNLLRQPEPPQEEEIRQDEQKVDESEEILEEEEEFGDDNDYDASNRKEQQVSTPATSAPPKQNNRVQIRPFAFRRRTKRQVDYGSRKYNNFRRPAPKSVTQRAPEPEPETESPAPPSQRRNNGRFNTRTSTNTRTTTAASPRVSSRQPFIIRGESRVTTTASPAYRRGKTRPSSRTTTISSRPKAPRLQSERSRSSPSRTTSRSSRTKTTTSRGTSRQRGSYENTSGERNFNHLINDGKITVTHQIPTEATIPVVNGKHTEYKNVLTAKPSLETLLLNQVSTSIGPLGIQQLVLVSEATELAENGATKIIRFILQETPTTTVVFTPTKIRGHATSYPHILPSTVYNVEPVTQTIAPEINANVPLANLLLSQLLLGNQQPAINPLLALQGQGLLPQQPVVQTPITEYKTRSTTYVTTVTDARETVLPITFRGIPILTTITDPTTNVITATEFVTDTIVTTPTALAQPQQFNSLLLPLLLQQQQQQQQALSLQTANPLLGLPHNDLSLVPNNNLNNDIYSNSPKPNILSDLSSNEDFSEDDQQDNVEEAPTQAPPPPPSSRSRNKPRPAKPAPVKHTSVVTLYVSGRYPGEFSTVLSTVVSDDTQTVRKREAMYYEHVKVLPSILPSVDELLGSQIDNNLENSVVVDVDQSDKSQLGTESLESIVGEVSRHIQYDASPTYVVKLANPSVTDTRQSSVDRDVS